MSLSIHYNMAYLTIGVLSTSWIKPSHTWETQIYENNYQIVMVGSLMRKLFGYIMEATCITWKEFENVKKHYQVKFLQVKPQM